MTSKILWAAAIASCIAGIATAAPALRTVRTLTQPDGTQLQAIAYGDEYFSFMADAASGQCLTQDKATGFWRPMSDDEATLTLNQWNTARRIAAAEASAMANHMPSQGHVLVPVVPVQFADFSFRDDHGTPEHLEIIYNQVDETRYAMTGADKKDYYTSGLRQYFRDQSQGKFDPEFVINKPVTLAYSRAYYGNNSGDTKDVNYAILLSEAIDSLVARGALANGSQFDYDGDGQIDLIHFLFAGHGENTTGHVEEIWAKKGVHSVDVGNGLTTGNFILVPEFGVYRNDTVESTIGEKAHEMSHALGLPDFYSTNKATVYDCYGMDGWSLMDQGMYSGGTQIPATYTLSERMQLGWSGEPDSVRTVGKVTLGSIFSTGNGLILRNPANENEYITIENHQPDNIWDMMWGNSSYTTYNRNRGLLITHVDYLPSAWSSNTVNNSPSHQRCSPLPADGELLPYSAFNDGLVDANAFIANYFSDIFPGYRNVKVLNPLANKTAIWFTGDSIKIDITNIEFVANGAVEITFGNPSEEVPEDTIPDGIETLSESGALAKKTKHIVLKNGRFFINGHDLYGRKCDEE